MFGYLIVQTILVCPSNLIFFLFQVVVDGFKATCGSNYLRDDFILYSSMIWILVLGVGGGGMGGIDVTQPFHQQHQL